MIRLTDLRLDLDHADADLPSAVRARLALPDTVPATLQVARRGYDARARRAIKLVYTVDVALDPALERDLLARDARLTPTPDSAWHFHPDPPPPDAARPVVIGAGPCGLFAALCLAQWGYRPIIIERGRAVRPRTADTWRLWRGGILDPESNVQFGEGGAGTFSDGKLWSGVSDPLHLGRKVLAEMVRAGAPEEILTVSKPHIGTFRLVTVVTSLRAQIEALGGEYRFETRLTGLDTTTHPTARLTAPHLTALRLADGTTIPATDAILAPGHSARDLFAALHADGLAMDAKPFSIGVRIEHPQAMIDRARFGPHAGHPVLGAADYKLVHHAANGRSAYSFCMCPGGQVVAAASEPGGLATNGMSQYSRAERNANAGLVVGITPADYPGGPLAGIDYQRHWERLAFEAGGGTYRAPAQRVGDFLAARPSTMLGDILPSYQPGVTPTDLALCLPPLRGRDPARGHPRLRPPHPRLRPPRRRHDRRRDPHLVASAHRPGRHPPVPHDPRPLPRRRRRRLCRRHPVRRHRRHPRRRSPRPRPPVGSAQVRGMSWGSAPGPAHIKGIQTPGVWRGAGQSPA